MNGDLTRINSQIYSLTFSYFYAHVCTRAAVFSSCNLPASLLFTLNSWLLLWHFISVYTSARHMCPFVHVSMDPGQTICHALFEWERKCISNLTGWPLLDVWMETLAAKWCIHAHYRPGWAVKKAQRSVWITCLRCDDGWQRHFSFFRNGHPAAKHTFWLQQTLFYFQTLDIFFVFIYLYDIYRFPCSKHGLFIVVLSFTVMACFNCFSWIA